MSLIHLFVNREQKRHDNSIKNMQFNQCVIVVVWMYLVSVSDSYSYNESVQLVSDVLVGYDSEQRPVLDQMQPVNVSVNFFLFTIQDFDEVAEKFSVYGILWLRWQDQLIHWDPNNYGGASSATFKISKVWYPKLVLVKPYAKLKDVSDDWMIVRIYSPGFTSFAPGAVFETTCSVDVTYYPFDTQNCSLNFNIWGYFGNEVVLLAPHSSVNTDGFTENGEWALVSTSVSRFAGNNYMSDEIHFNFILKRKPTFLVVNVILPITFMAVMNLLVFVLPAESGERVSFSVTVLLALAVFLTLVGDNLPKTSEPMSVLSYYLTSLLVLSTLMTATTIFNLKIYYKSGQVPACWKSLARLVHCFPKQKRNLENKVSPSEEHNIELPVKAAFANTNTAATNETEITWQDVSFAIDMISMIIFCIGTFVVNIVFLVVLTQNN